MSTHAIKVKDVQLTRDEIDPSKIVSGSPEVASAILSTSYNGNIIRGIWSCTEGTLTDVEADEIFTVVEGRATVISKSFAFMKGILVSNTLQTGYCRRRANP